MRSKYVSTTHTRIHVKNIVLYHTRRCLSMRARISVDQIRGNKLVKTGKTRTQHINQAKSPRYCLGTMR